jgi:hypothetical protein
MAAHAIGLGVRVGGESLCVCSIRSEEVSGCREWLSGSSVVQTKHGSGGDRYQSGHARSVMLLLLLLLLMMMMMVSRTQDLTLNHVLTALTADQPLRADPWASHVVLRRLLTCSLAASCSVFLFVLASHRRFTLHMPHGEFVPNTRGADRGLGDDHARGASDEGASAASPCPETCRQALTGYLPKLARTGAPFQIYIGPVAVGRCSMSGRVAAAAAAAAATQGDAPERAAEKGGHAGRAEAAVATAGEAWLASLMPPARAQLLCAYTDAESRVEVDVQMADGRRCTGQCGVGASRRVMSASAVAGVGVTCLAGWALADEVVQEVLLRGLPGCLAVVSGCVRKTRAASTSRVGEG